jgi:hypothetical protein
MSDDKTISGTTKRISIDTETSRMNHHGVFPTGGFLSASANVEIVWATTTAAVVVPKVSLHKSSRYAFGML